MDPAPLLIHFNPNLLLEAIYSNYTKHMSIVWFISLRIIYYWNRLPENIVNARLINLFKNYFQIEQHYITL